MDLNPTKGVLLLTTACLHRLQKSLADAPRTCPAFKTKQPVGAAERAPRALCRGDELVSALLPARKDGEELNPDERQVATYAQGVAMGLCASYQPLCDRALQAVEGSAWDDAQLCALRQLGVGHGTALSGSIVSCPGTLTPAFSLSGIFLPHQFSSRDS